MSVVNVPLSSACVRARARVFVFNYLFIITLFFVCAQSDELRRVMSISIYISPRPANAIEMVRNTHIG